MTPSPSCITSLADGEVFVFGSNLAGRHGRGAARQARVRFGAALGVGAGPTGRCYAIPTKDSGLRQLPLHIIRMHVITFLAYADEEPDLTFLVTEIGCGLAGYRVSDIAPLFFDSGPAVPRNVRLPASFIAWRESNHASQ